MQPIENYFTEKRQIVYGQVYLYLKNKKNYELILHLFYIVKQNTTKTLRTFWAA
jgi:hypothetical protein